MLIDIAVVALVALAVVWDIRIHKIPNWLTFTAVAAGVGLNMWQAGFSGLVVSLQGLLVGLAVFLIPFVLGGMGGGDVKLIGAIGALKGWVFVLHVALFTALWGGVIALLAVVITKQFKVLHDFGIGLGLFVWTSGKIGVESMLPHEKSVSENQRLVVPYGIAIFAGTISAYFVNFVNVKIPG
ncbi:MAG: prepilin peptidase [Candidatus Desulforudis sp.]|nr:prepilin peptidase [Desulforudis sp.]